MKHFYLPFILFFSLFSSTNFAQYLENFSIDDKGLLSGTGATCPTNTLEACANYDFSGVNWTINGNFTGFDTDDFVKTNAPGAPGVLFFSGDIDEELCFESPLLDISGVAGTFSISVDIVWTHHDNAEYVDVEYNIDNGGWVTVPIQYGDNTGTGHTVDFSGSGATGSGTVSQTGLTGSSTLRVRVCADSNTISNGESHSIDNVSVPEANVIVLPVELISFKAEKREDEVMLNWTTASETNNEKFEIEHSTNDKPFEKIGEIKGNETTLQTSQYSFQHRNPSVGLNYYRLKQIDFDGKFEYSNVVSVQVESKKKSVGDFYPTPTEDGIVFLDFTSNAKSDLTISIFDATGKNILDQKVDIVKGENKLNFDFSTLEKGIYFVQLGNIGHQEYRKLIIN